MANSADITGLSPGQVAFPTREVRQLEFFPRRAKIHVPPMKQTVESLGSVLAEDSSWYYVKGDVQNKPTRANEWICQQIAERVGIVAPSACVIEMTNGEWVFGSRKITAVEDDVGTYTFLTTPTLTGGLTVSDLGKLLSGIYAFDMCLQNHDRHLNNYLSVLDGAHRTLYVYDFGLALFYDWPWSGFPPLGCRTRDRGKLLRMLHGFDLSSAIMILDRIASVVKSEANIILNSVPPAWLSDDLREQLYQFWLGGKMDVRIATLKGGLADASLL